MFKKTVLFLSICLLSACATLKVKPVPSELRAYQRPDFFSQGQTQAAFKLQANAKDNYVQGVMRVNRLGEDDFDVMVFGEGMYRVMNAVVTPEGVAYKFLMKPADTSAVRKRIDGFLTLFLYPPNQFVSARDKNGYKILTYGAPDGKARYFYREGETLPEKMIYDKFLGSATLLFAEYTPYGEEGEMIPHLIIYDDGAINAEMTLISMKGASAEIF